MGLYRQIEKRIDKKALIGITGGGGKTTLMENLGYYLKKQGYSVLITTTTRVASPLFHDYKVDYIYSDESVLAHEIKKGESVFYADKSYDLKKWISPSIEVIKLLTKLYDIVIYEADGSRGLPLKIHTERDPVIIENSDIIIGVMGLWGIGHNAHEMCFGDGSDRIIDKAYLDEYINNKEGLTKGMDGANDKIFVFNGGDCVSKEVIDMAIECKHPDDISIYVASEKEDKVYAYVE